MQINIVAKDWVGPFLLKKIESDSPSTISLAMFATSTSSPCNSEYPKHTNRKYIVKTKIRDKNRNKLSR